MIYVLLVVAVVLVVLLRQHNRRVESYNAALRAQQATAGAAAEPPPTARQRNALFLFGETAYTKRAASQALDAIFADPVKRALWTEYLETTGATGDEPELLPHDLDKLAQRAMSRADQYGDD